MLFWVTVLLRKPISRAIDWSFDDSSNFLLFCSIFFGIVALFLWLLGIVYTPLPIIIPIGCNVIQFIFGFIALTRK